MLDEIRTERLRLRQARMEDLAAMHAILCDARAMRYWSTPPHSDIDESETWLRSMVDVDPAVGDDFIVTLDGAVIGKLGAWKLPEVGFLLAPAYWGRGLALEAMRAFIARRRDCGSTELTADVDPRNLQSLRLLERCGFEETHRASGTWQVGDELCDSVYLRLAL